MKTIPNSLLPLALVVTLVAITPLAGGQSTFTTLYSFTNGVPQSLVSSNGAFFGAFGGVGASGSECGAIFQLQPPAIESGDWAEEAVYSFSGAGQGPCNPDFGPAIGSNGALYGLTTQGGAYGEGTLYMLEPPNSAGGVWTAAVLYSFGAAGTYDAPGGGGLIPGPGGSYYFLSSAGGAYGYGALVQMQPPTVPGAGWSASILYSFPEGVMANSITVGPGGVFYGTAAPFEEVKRQYGLVFRILPPADSPKGEWTLSVLYTFLPGEGTTGNPIALNLARYGRHVDNRAALVFPHDRCRQPGAVPGSLQMHVDDLIELLFGHLAHRRVAGDSGVVDHDVQAAEVVDGGRDESLHLGGLRHIAPHRQGDITAAQLFGRGFGRLEVQVTEHNPRAFGDETLRNGKTQTLCAACDHRCLTAQQRHRDHASLGSDSARGTHRSEYHISYRILPGAGVPTRTG